MQELVRRPVLYEDRYPKEDEKRQNMLDVTGYSVGKVAAEQLFTAAGAITYMRLAKSSPPSLQLSLTR